MTDHFDKWINSMSDLEYEDWLEAPAPIGATDRQEEKALNIRTPPTKEELEDLELEQEFEEVEERGKPEQLEEREERIRIERKEAREPITKEISIPRGVDKVTVTELPQRVGAPIIQTKVGERITMVRPAIPKPMIPPKPPNFIKAVTSRVGSVLRSSASVLRRIFRI